MPIGSSGVVNQANTTTGLASGVVANASSGYGDDVGGSGLVDLYSTGAPSYLLMEDGSFLLQENGDKIQLEQ